MVDDVGTEECQNNYTDSEVCLGQPGGGELALQGGWVMGTFEGKYAIGPGWSFTIHELGSGGGGTDEPFAVFLATDLDCMKSANPKQDCMKKLDKNGNGTTTFVVGE